MEVTIILNIFMIGFIVLCYMGKHIDFFQSLLLIILLGVSAQLRLILVSIGDGNLAIIKTLSAISIAWGC